MYARWMVSVILVSLAGAVPLLAQNEPGHRFTLTAGPAPYDLSGTGTAFHGAARLSGQLTDHVSVEGGASYFRYETQFGGTVNALFPETSLMVSRAVGRARPFTLAGFGFGWQRQDGENTTDATLHLGVGSEWWMGERWGLRGEFRLRAVHPWVGTIADIGFGVTGRL